ncbi:MAG: Transglutaminase-like superfamily protein [Bacteroidetes bacterium ADurb.Bin037]|nr:MAG: Transglutaminase-like superfamily protein [Bacteroidetes bacterium ADurb.Bin037]HPW78192.1 transglutaminase domain-containing protein [Bacteroidales bacterium]HQB55794.1 transglutaminase domain-containing protein [Bacteroidales bacterium]
MNRYLQVFLALLLLAACNGKGTKPTPDRITALMTGGQFQAAEKMIRQYTAVTSLPCEEKLRWDWEIERMQRISLDFNKSETEALDYIRQYFPDVTAEQMSAWEASGALECMVIDNEKRYFSRAFRNLFRIDSTCKAKFEEVNGPAKNVKAPLLQKHLPEIVRLTRKKGTLRVEPVTYTITYTLTVPANTIPEGETIRAWMPLPRTDVPRQSGFRLLSASEPDYIISPDNYVHKSIYMEKTAVTDQDAVFEYTFTYTAQAQYHHFDPLKDILPYNTDSPVYKEYIKEVPPHILTGGPVAELAKKIVGQEENPFLQLQKIFTYISQTYPWAGAREYSTIESIPLYVLENNHGDCGQVSLLFISMCRSLGIPARWESGWMLHPGEINLHDWAEAYLEGIGWIPIDQSFGLQPGTERLFYSRGMDSYRMAVNTGIGGSFFPAKIYPRSETVDFQRGEVEWRGGNLYFNRWNYSLKVHPSNK